MSKKEWGPLYSPWFCLQSRNFDSQRMVGFKRLYGLDSKIGKNRRSSFSSFLWSKQPHSTFKTHPILQPASSARGLDIIVLPGCACCCRSWDGIFVQLIWIALDLRPFAPLHFEKSSHHRREEAEKSSKRSSNWQHAKTIQANRGDLDSPISVQIAQLTIKCILLKSGYPKLFVKILQPQMLYWEARSGIINVFPSFVKVA